VAERLSPTLKAVSDAVLAVAAELSVEEVLQRLVDSARELAGARFAALGLPDGDGGFGRFLTSGMSDKLIASLGELPRPHRTRDVHAHPAFRGWWPPGHPDMRSFLGVPIVTPEGVIGAFYLTEKLEAADFTDEDEELIALLAAHAAIAITNARLYERSRELSTVEERNRLALDLHDSVSQKLFALVLTAEAAGTLLDRDAPAAREQVATLATQARDALDELRGLVFELRPPDLEKDGLCGAVRKHVELVRRMQGLEIDLDLTDDAQADAARDREVLRIAQEALQNAVKHAKAKRVTVKLQADNDRLLLEVSDDGVGFDPEAAALRARRLGLTSMRERAERVGGTLAIRSGEGGTTVHLEVGGG
jgi:signal transduction histidine kinase